MSGIPSYIKPLKLKLVIIMMSVAMLFLKKYGTHRFTPRDFWTSENQNQTPEMSRRMRYDRDIVEEHYAIAFIDLY